MTWQSSTRSPTAEAAGTGEELPSYFDGPPLGAARPRLGAEAWWTPAGEPPPHGRAGPAGAGSSAVTATAVFGGGLPPQPLWTNRTAGLSLTFVRALDLPFADCSLALAAWWERATASGGPRRRSGPLCLGRGRLTGPPRPAAGAGGQSWRAPAVLHPGLGCPPRPMTLELQPWFETFGTKLALQPAGAVRGSRRYFAAGHELLDRLIDGLMPN